MRFNKIEIHGFKSFPEPMTIEFDKGITCIVGPNGSGKSNICDALRWVLGSQSAKELRGDKMEDIIFDGTTNRKSRGMAEVSLYIENEDGALPIDYNEVAITRRLYRSGESEYFINNNRCRMKDIRNLILDTGIGVEGYSIIGQGRISDIISNDTESIREILEETAGIATYRNKKAEAQRKLKSAGDNMDRVNDIIGEIESRIGGLKEDSEKAQEYVVLNDRHKELEINITLKNIENLEEKNKEINEDLSGLNKNIQQRDLKKESIAENLNEDGEKRTKLDSKIEEARGRELALNDEINKLTNRREINEERIISIERSSKRLKGEVEELLTKIRREEDSSKELFELKEETHKKMEELQKAMEEAVSVYSNKSNKLQEMGNKVDDSKNKLFNLQREISTKSIEINSVENLKETLTRRREEVLKEQGQGGDGLADSKKDLERCQKEREALEETLKKVTLEKETLREVYSTSLKDERNLTREIEELKINGGQLESRKKTFEEMASNYEGFGHGVKFIMKGEKDGLDGVVADIINVPEGFETAIETALGGKLQNVVCKDDATAKRAVKKLKENKAGRLTFLPLTSIKKSGVLKEDVCESAKGFKGYGVDCISCEEKYKDIAEYLLGNVVVMENMDNAIELSKKLTKKIKLVTLEGEIINRAGAITGGRTKHKTANILERKAEIAKLEDKISAMAKEEFSKEDKLAKTRSSIKEAEEKLDQIEVNLRSGEMELLNKENEISIIKTSLDDMESTNKRWIQELKNIDGEEANAENILKQRGEEIKAATSKKDALEIEIEKMTKLYEEEREKLSSDSEKITEARIALSTQEQEKNNIDAIVSRVTDSIEEFSREKESKEEELNALQKEKDELLTGGGNAAAKVKEKEEEQRETVKELESLRQEKNALLIKIEEDTRGKEALEEELSSLQNQKYELDIRKTRQETQLENAKNKLWEEFEVSYMQALDYRKDDFVMSAAVKENRSIKNRIKELGEVNIGAIEEYAKISERYEFLTGQRQDIETSMRELNGIITDMDRIIKTRFKTSFDSVVENFEEVFQELYGGGHANISLTDISDPFDSEIEINAQPPGKQLKHIDLLSGGEKTMTAIALMFAVLKTKPTPCCILDEVEAALDDSNLEIFGNYLKKFENVQFTLITHQKSTMEHADAMYGITMAESGVSKIYSLKMDEEDNNARQ